MKTLKSLALAACLLAAAGAATAQSYGGIGLGHSSAHFSGDYSMRSANVAEATNGGNTGIKVMMGYQVTPTWAMEVAYNHLGSSTYSYANPGLGFAGQAKATHIATTFAVKGTHPVAEKWSLIGKLGMSHNQASVNGNTNNNTVNGVIGWPKTLHFSSLGVVAGVGAEYALTKTTKLRMEYEDFGNFGTGTNPTSNASLASVSWVSSF